MDKDDIPSWVLSLDHDDLEFIRKFVIHSGSLKEMAKEYGVSYPTVRTKLDRLILKIQSRSNEQDVEFIQLIKSLAIEERISLDAAKIIIEHYKKSLQRNEQEQ